MTPQLLQAIKLLQLSNLELASFIEEELERNPLLERADDVGPTNEPAEPMPAEPAAERDWNTSELETDHRDLEAGLGPGPPARGWGPGGRRGPGGEPRPPPTTARSRTSKVTSPPSRASATCCTRSS